MIRTALLLLLVLVAAAIGARRANAFDATGHWVGKWSCKSFSAPFTQNGKLVNKYTLSNSDSTLDITQTQTFAAVIDRFSGASFYNAVAVPAVKDAANNGNIILLSCNLGTTLPQQGVIELMQASIKTKTGTFKATFKGTSIFADHFPEAAICKYSYKRMDTNDPQAGACP
jgi:hypothetical protein